MNSRSNLMRRLTPIMLAGVLAACASPDKVGTAGTVDHLAHQRAGTSGPGQMGMMGQMDMKSMCAMHHNMMAKKTPEERDAMMTQHMKSMSPEMRRQHMAMMDEKCR
ncbi:MULTISPECIES: hypothetical protein [Noviherbaspirillum]|uniref:DUF305 domain-containing protein n=2 Tax=Noviherbaspirillum TaxID=1344552 RepID=A0ABU6JIH8_9BURK|nr:MULTISPECIES: hypothetical protein [Noviherbaspirillum]MEC4722879.1 hypothetical protein [Noviherbaspirillum sp. CPCC 100848]